MDILDDEVGYGRNPFAYLFVCVLSSIQVFRTWGGRVVFFEWISLTTESGMEGIHSGGWIASIDLAVRYSFGHKTAT